MKEPVKNEKHTKMKNPHYKLTPEEKKFVAYHAKLRDELNTASWHFSTWKYLQDLRKDYLRELNQAPTFFSPTIRAHLFETVMRLCKFFDYPDGNRTDTLTIYEFLNFVERNRYIFFKRYFCRRINLQYGKDDDLNRYRIDGHKIITSLEIQSHRKRIEHLPVKNLRKWRLKSLAHIDKGSIQNNIDVFKNIH